MKTATFYSYLPKRYTTDDGLFLARTKLMNNH